MMRRFTRRRRGGPRPDEAPIEAKSLFEKMLELGVVPAASLEPLATEEIPSSLAAIATGEAKSGGRLLVAYSPAQASHAVLSALAVGARLAEAEKFDGDFYAVAPSWNGAGRRMLAIAGTLPFRLKPVAAPSLSADGGSVLSEPVATSGVLTAAQIAGHLARPADRDLFLRASRGLEGLAAKHGGALRGYGRAVDFVLLARRVAELRAEQDGVALVTSAPQRSTVRLTPENLSGSLDAFEGQLRKRMNDRRTREGEEGLRARAITAFRNWHSLRGMVLWPLGGSDGEVLDWVGVDVEGRPVIGAAREHLGLEALAEIVDASLRLQASLPSVLAHAAPPVILDAPRLVVGGREIALGLGRALDSLALTHELFEIRGDAELELSAIAAGEAPARERPPQRRERRPRPPRAGAEEPSEEVQANPDLVVGDDSAEESSGAPSGRSRGRRRSRRGRGRRDSGPRESTEESGGGGTDEPAKPAMRFEEVSLFDLDDEPSEREGGGRGRQRGRGRRRPRGRASDDSRGGDSGEEKTSSSADAPGERAPRRRGGGPSPAASDESDEPFPEDDDADLALDLELEEVPDFETSPAPSYEDDEEVEADPDEDARTLARSQQRQSRQGPAVEAVVEAPKLPRRRAAILAHADRDSLIAAILIARDIRLVEGIWVYPQSELMSFFRGVTTDLRDDAPIYVIGFTPSPAVDVLQAASLYRNRITWFDHQEWPPEDLQALRDAIGEDAVKVARGADSTLPLVLDLCSRRSRFTDKLVDLAAGRFTHHDYERWGRLWWWRLGEIVQNAGDRRHDVDALLSGRPSDLAREAAGADTPPIPPEVEYVSKRDFRLVHFAGYGLVVAEIPPELDLHLTARVIRERYGASLSLAYRPGSESIVFAGDELAGRRSLDLGALVEHICNKLEWVEQLPDTDHVARMRVRDLETHPGRLDDIVAEIAMGRSILER